MKNIRNIFIGQNGICPCQVYRLILIKYLYIIRVKNIDSNIYNTTVMAQNVLLNSRFNTRLENTQTRCVIAKYKQ